MGDESEQMADQAPTPAAHLQPFLGIEPPQLLVVHRKPPPKAAYRSVGGFVKVVSI